MEKGEVSFKMIKPDHIFYLFIIQNIFSSVFNIIKP